MTMNTQNWLSGIPEETLAHFIASCGTKGETVSGVIHLCMEQYIEKNLDVYSEVNTIAERNPLFLRVAEFESMGLFNDMCFSPESIVNEFLKGQIQQKDGSFTDTLASIPHELRYFDIQSHTYHIEKDCYNYGWFDGSDRSFHVREDKLDDDSTILHEMIHMHEYWINKQRRFYHDILFLLLYNDLKPKISSIGQDLDALILSHAHVFESQRIINIGGEHDVLFYLKSLDLDIKMGFPLGRVCGYGREIKDS